MGTVRTDHRRMALNLLATAREMLGYEFPSQDALDKYLKDHPKAKRDNHWIKDVKPKEKSEDSDAKSGEKTEDSAGGKFSIPEHKSLKYKTPGTLADIDRWEAKIVLGNSMGEGKKKGDMDEVGYVGINIRTNEIVPIARADEHRAGYELLDHLHDKGMIKGRPQDFITLFPGTNYPHYMTHNSHDFVEGCKKWLAYGGKNVAVHAQDTSKGYNSKSYVTDMEEYVSLNGKMPYGQKGPSKAGREVLDNLEGAVAALRADNPKEAFERTGRLLERLETFDSYTIRDIDALRSLDKSYDEAKEEDDKVKLGKVLKGVAKEMQRSLKDERGNKFSYVPGFYGTGDEADKRIDKVAGGEILPEKADDNSLSSSGQNVVDHFGRAARVITYKWGIDLERLQNAAMDLVLDLQPMIDDVDGLGGALERLHRASGGDNVNELQQALFSFNGVKNLLHQRLRKLQANGVTKDKHFGNVKLALAEFDRLSQI